MDFVKFLLRGVAAVAIAVFFLGIIVISGISYNLQLAALFVFFGGLALLVYSLWFKKK